MGNRADKTREALYVVGAIEMYSESDERGVCLLERFVKKYVDRVKAYIGVDT